MPPTALPALVLAMRRPHCLCVHQPAPEIRDSRLIRFHQPTFLIQTSDCHADFRARIPAERATIRGPAFRPPLSPFSQRPRAEPVKRFLRPGPNPCFLLLTVHSGTSCGARLKAKLSQQHQRDHNQQHRSQRSAGVIAPASAIRPGRCEREQQYHEQEYQQHIDLPFQFPDVT